MPNVTHQVTLWVGAIAGIQLRLVCNLMDGLLAVEGGLKSPVGDLYNEVPDRVADVLLLVAAGYGVEYFSPWMPVVGWAAAVGAMTTTYVRALGASLTGKQDFSGPLAKQQRMFFLTLGCIGSIAELLIYKQNSNCMSIGIFLHVIALGSFCTAWIRVKNIAAILRSRAS